jgi:hypothetical protein
VVKTPSASSQPKTKHLTIHITTQTQVLALKVAATTINFYITGLTEQNPMLPD